MKASQEQLGHSSASTTRDLYCQDKFSYTEMQEIFEGAIWN